MSKYYIVKGRLCETFGVVTKPDDHFGGLIVDDAHKSHLVRLLRVVALVNGIRPGYIHAVGPSDVSKALQ